jgi:hypothetical protein
MDKFWTVSTGNNWNPCINSGLILDALAIGDVEPGIAESILSLAIPSVRQVLQHYSVDNGVWYEGPDYYEATSGFTAVMLAGLDSALGTDFGLSETPGLNRAGLFATYGTGPSGVQYDFSDSTPYDLSSANGSITYSRAVLGSFLYWYAERYDQPEYAWYERTNDGVPPLANPTPKTPPNTPANSTYALGLLWYDPQGSGPAESGLSPDQFFYGATNQPQFFNKAKNQPADPSAEVVTFRTNWDQDATYVATKAGLIGDSNLDSHGFMDAGSFVLDAEGQRWVQQLGKDSYTKTYFKYTEQGRYSYYRARSEGSNTLVVNPSMYGGQDIGSNPVVTLFQSGTGDADSRTIINLTPAYQGQGVTQLWRGFALTDNRQDLLVEDEIQAPQSTPANVWWFAHILVTTRVQIAADGKSAILTQDGQRLWVGILSGPADASLQLMAALPLPTSPNPPGQNPTTNYKKLAIDLTGVTNARLAVLFAPLAPGQSQPATVPTVMPLASWGSIASLPIIRFPIPLSNPSPSHPSTNGLETAFLTVARAGEPIDMLSSPTVTATHSTAAFISPLVPETSLFAKYLNGGGDNAPSQDTSGILGDLTEPVPDPSTAYSAEIVE